MWRILIKEIYCHQGSSSSRVTNPEPLTISPFQVSMRPLGPLTRLRYVLPWFARVPSISNIADYPSRQLEHPLLVKDTMVPQEEVGRSFEESLTFLKGALTPP